jgi:hypothetical protein
MVATFNLSPPAKIASPLLVSSDNQETLCIFPLGSFTSSVAQVRAVCKKGSAAGSILAQATLRRVWPLFEGSHYHQAGRNKYMQNHRLLTAVLWNQCKPDLINDCCNFSDQPCYFISCWCAVGIVKWKLEVRTNFLRSAFTAKRKVSMSIGPCQSIQDQCLGQLLCSSSEDLEEEASEACNVHEEYRFKLADEFQTWKGCANH